MAFSLLFRRRVASDREVAAALARESLARRGQTNEQYKIKGSVGSGWIPRRDATAARQTKLAAGRSASPIRSTLVFHRWGRGASGEDGGVGAT